MSKKCIKRGKGILLLCLLMLITGGCNTVKNDTGTPVRVGFFPNISHAQALVGKENGLFQKNLGDKNPVQWIKFNAGPAEIEAMFAGEVDMGYIGPGPAINGYVKSDGDIQVLSGATGAGAILVSRKGLAVSTVRDLSGRKVAVPQFGNTQDLALRYLLKQNGLKETSKGGTVEIKQVENPDVKTLMEKGEIDAAIVPEPWGSRLVSEIQASIILDYNQLMRDGKYATGVVIARKSFMKEHPDLVESFIKAHVDITEFILKNPDEAKKMTNKQIEELTRKPLTDEVLNASFKRLTFSVDPEKQSFDDFVKMSVEAGFLKQQPDITDIFNLQYLNNVLKEKGKNPIN